ncbi:acyl-CoA N-acyltransferase [Trichophaea hybrida]|nr:acyl-CoA N-acyltransferase [Trichophaea hybrida]
MVSSSKPFVRRYNPTTDYDAIVKICEATAHASVRPVSPLIPYLYAIPYLQLSPSYIHVLDTPSGVAGYIMGVPSTTAFVEAYNAHYVPTLSFPSLPEPLSDQAQQTIALAKNGDRILIPVLDEFPAHLHINILDEYQGMGWGSTLMHTLLQQLVAEDVQGIYLGMAEDNDRAGRFYERHGFVEVVVEGEKGKGAKWLTKKLSI